MIVVLSGLWAGACERTLDLDEDTLLQIDKQQKMEQLDRFYELAFTDPQRAEVDFDRYVKTELLTERQNFLSDYQINSYYTLVTLAIRMTTNEMRCRENCDKSSLFALYKARDQTSMFNRTLMASIPQQLKQGGRLERFEERVASIGAFFADEIAAFRRNSVADERLAGKKWEYTGYAVKWDYSKLYLIRFDFTLNADKTWEYGSFFFLPAIAMGTLSTEIDEVGFETAWITSPLEYATYDDHICFYFDLKSTYDPATESGKLARSWCYEYRYEVTDQGVALSEPRISLDMYPQSMVIEYGDLAFTTKYLDAYTGFDQPFLLTQAP